MSNNEPSRLDRLEALAGEILAGLQETRAIANSNAKSIQALSGEWQKDREQWEKDREQWEKDRKGTYQLLGRLTRSMSDFYEVQADFYNRFDQIDSRQADIAEILRELKREPEKPNDTH
jgi:hypothetical protein